MKEKRDKGIVLKVLAKINFFKNCYVFTTNPFLEMRDKGIVLANDSFSYNQAFTNN